METAAIVQFQKKQEAKYTCSACGADRVCDCNAPALKRAADAIAADPRKSNRAIAEEIGVSHMTVGRARVEHDVPVKCKNSKPEGAGPKISFLNGYTCLTEAVANAINVERESKDPGKAAQQGGFSRNSYCAMRDIVLLTERNDLSDREVAIVKKAVSALNETRQYRKPYAEVKPIILKIWGRKGGRFTADKKRLESFLSSISIAVTASTVAAEIPIPAISKTQMDAALADLKEAVKALRVLYRRIKKGS